MYFNFFVFSTLYSICVIFFAILLVVLSVVRHSDSFFLYVIVSSVKISFRYCNWIWSFPLKMCVVVENIKNLVIWHFFPVQWSWYLIFWGHVWLPAFKRLNDKQLNNKCSGSIASFSGKSWPNTAFNPQLLSTYEGVGGLSLSRCYISFPNSKLR